mgnify:CR=1 FL=1
MRVHADDDDVLRAIRTVEPLIQNSARERCGSRGRLIAISIKLASSRAHHSASFRSGSFQPPGLPGPLHFECPSTQWLTLAMQASRSSRIW